MGLHILVSGQCLDVLRHALTGGKVSNVGQDVQYSDEEQSNEAVLLDRLDRILARLSSQVPSIVTMLAKKRTLISFVTLNEFS